MALSKSTRIIILLVIDTAFFLLELITGYAVHSLALVADAFHMLNDVLSLCVGLWAVKVANSRSNEKTYTYGWQRAETLGALLNGVFLVALCVSIFLEAIQRFVEPQEVSNPKLILIVGSLGLASNLLGLLLFHDHSHSHGGGGHSHSHGDGMKHAEEGHAHGDVHDQHEAQAADETGNVADVLPQNRIGGWPRTRIVEPEETNTGARNIKQRRHSRSGSRAFSGIEDLPINPSYMRQSIIEAAADRHDENSAVHADDDDDDTHDHSGVSAPLLQNGHKTYGSTKRKPHDHSGHNHQQPREAASGGHGHSHGDLNMRGVFLHVLGDALGNIGVIGTALFIWLTDFSWRFYADPAISLVITAIILASAIPLCKAASRILLQAVPPGLNVDEIKQDIMSLPGVLSIHEMHVWQLSDTTLIASLHVHIAIDFKNEDAGRYMELANAINTCLHEYGIHSVTIQPEFCLNGEHDHTAAIDQRDGAAGPSTTASKAGSVHDSQNCMLECGDSCEPGSTCCPPKSDAEHEGHHHDDEHEHDHSH